MRRARVARLSEIKAISPPNHVGTKSWPITESLGGCKNVVLHVSEMEPGGSALKHTHANSEQLYVVLSGSGEMTVGQESFHVQTGDTIYIPENVEHDTKVTGEEVFRCVVILAPPPRD